MKKWKGVIKKTNTKVTNVTHGTAKSHLTLQMCQDPHPSLRSKGRNSG